MEHLQRLTAMLIVSILCTACAQRAKDEMTEKSFANLNSTLWMQNSSEFQANSLQTYNTAISNLKKTVKDTTETAALEQTVPYTSLPPAVILDIDETVLDNSMYDARLILAAERYNPESWDQWIALKQAPAVPGAVKFINHAQRAGVEVIFITNRMCKQREGSSNKCPQKVDTMENLERVGVLGVDPANVLLRSEQAEYSAEKEGRRKIVTKKYRIVMLFGDDLGDFLPNVKNKISSEQRARLVAAHSEKWGNVWYILPNPKYGSWLRILDNPKSQYLEGY